MTEKNETCSFEQKPIEIDIFNDEEEKEVKERVGKRKTKRQEVAKKNKLLKRKKKVEENKEDEKEMWERLRKIKKEFKDINPIKTGLLRALRSWRETKWSTQCIF